MTTDNENDFEPLEDPAEVAHYREGFSHFNARRYWEAHESWEEVWLPREGAEALFFQALIQLAAGFHHVTHTGRYHGAVASWSEAHRKLAGFAGEVHGVLVDKLRLRLSDLIDRAAAVEGGTPAKQAFAEGAFFMLEARLEP